MGMNLLRIAHLVQAKMLVKKCPYICVQMPTVMEQMTLSGKIESIKETAESCMCRVSYSVS